MTPRTLADILRDYEAGQNIFRRPSVEILVKAIRDRDAEIERLKQDVKALKDRADWAVNHIKEADESVAVFTGDDDLYGGDT